MADYSKEVESMISKVEKRKELSRPKAIEHMLEVATGRLTALWKYAAETAEPKAKKSKAAKKPKAAKKSKAKQTTIAAVAA